MGQYGGKKSIEPHANGLGNALTNLRHDHLRDRGEAGIHGEVRDSSDWTPIEKVRQHAMVDGDSARWMYSL